MKTIIKFTIKMHASVDVDFCLQWHWCWITNDFDWIECFVLCVVCCGSPAKWYSFLIVGTEELINMYTYHHYNYYHHVFKTFNKFLCYQATNETSKTKRNEKKNDDEKHEVNTQHALANIVMALAVCVVPLYRVSIWFSVRFEYITAWNDDTK